MKNELFFLSFSTLLSRERCRNATYQRRTYQRSMCISYQKYLLYLFCASHNEALQKEKLDVVEKSCNRACVILDLISGLYSIASDLRGCQGLIGNVHCLYDC